MSLQKPARDAPRLEGPLTAEGAAFKDRIELARNAAVAAEISHSTSQPGLVRHLQILCAALDGLSIRVAPGLGEAAFRLDPAEKTVTFNEEALTNIAAVATRLERSGARGLPNRAGLLQESVALFAFHEGTHIAQQLVRFSDVGSLKRAFGPDALSQIDLTADFRAAHCGALIEMAICPEWTIGEYIEAFGKRALLAYELLVGAFPLDGRAHKVRRALGLITCAASARLIRGNATYSNEILSDLFDPAYVSVDSQSGLVLGISSDHRLVHRLESTPVGCMALWDGVGALPSNDLVEMLMDLLRPRFC